VVYSLEFFKTTGQPVSSQEKNSSGHILAHLTVLWHPLPASVKFHYNRMRIKLMICRSLW